MRRPLPARPLLACTLLLALAGPPACGGEAEEGGPDVRPAPEAEEGWEPGSEAASPEAAPEEPEAATPPPGTPGATPGPRGDVAIFREVQRRLLHDPALERVAIRATVEDGVVTLRGRVADRETAREAGRIAAGVEGVVRVESRIEVEEGTAG